MSAEREMTVPEILDAFAQVKDHRFPRAALRSAEMRRKALVPHFREEIDLTLTLAREGKLQEEGDWRLANFALYLLAAWREPETYERLMQAMLLPDPYDREWLLADALDCDWAHLLLTTFPTGDKKETHRLQEIVLDADLHEDIRSTVLRVIGGLAHHRMIEREKVVTWIEWLFECDLNTPMAFLWNELAFQSAALKEPRLMVRVRELYARGWGEEPSAHLSNLEEIARSPWPEGNDIPCHVANPIGDIHAIIYEWSFFREGRCDPKLRAWYYKKIGYKPRSGRPGATFCPEPEIGRDERCPCGSGKKYRHCCGEV